MEKENKKVYLVLEYREKFTNKKKSIIVKGASKEALDAQTENFDTIEQLAALYFDWTNAFVEGPIVNLRDMYIISQKSVLGELLSGYEASNSSVAIADLSFYNQEIKDENGKTTMANMYEWAKELTPKMPVRIMKDRTKPLDSHIVDRVPNIPMPTRTKRI